MWCGKGESPACVARAHDLYVHGRDALFRAHGANERTPAGTKVIDL